MKNLIFLFISSIILVSCHSQGIKLSLNLEEGKEYSYTLTQQTNINQIINEINLETIIVNKHTISFLVKRITEDGYEWDATFKHISIFMKSGGQTSELSSDEKDASDLYTKVFQAIKNKPFRVFVNKQGKVLKVNIKTVLDGIINDLNESEQTKKQLRTEITPSFNETDLITFIERVTAIFPENTISKDEKWTVKTKSGTRMSGINTTVYEFEETANDYFKVNGESVFENENKNKFSDVNGYPMKYDISGHSEAKYKINKITGWVNSARITSKLDGFAYVKESEQMPNGMKIPMTMTVKITIMNNNR